MFWTAVAYRAGFLILIPLPLLLGGVQQIQFIILLTALMAIPLTALGVGFNVLFAAAVPPQWRAYMVGTRNVALALTFMVSSLGCGYLLDRLPFPQGYQVVFAIGFIGAALSTLHIYFIRPLVAGPVSASLPPGEKPDTERRRPRALRTLRLDIWRTPFRRVLLAMLGFHLSQYLAIPLFPLFFVDALALNDQQIGIGTAIFYLAVLLGSSQLHRASRRLSHQSLTAAGLVGMATYPFLLGLSSHVWQYYVISFLGGLGWSLASGASTNYMLERMPPEDRTAHFAWYTMVLNACVLTGSLLGPYIARNYPLSMALVIFGLMRALAALVLWRFG
jgi:MFS family permease